MGAHVHEHVTEKKGKERRTLKANNVFTCPHKVPDQIANRLIDK